MGTVGYYARLTSTDLDRLVAEPLSARRLAGDLVATGESDRFVDIDKAWDRIDWALTEIDFPVNVVYGEGVVPAYDDWGHTGFLPPTWSAKPPTPFPAPTA